MHILRKPNIFECRSIVLMLFGCSSSWPNFWSWRANNVNGEVHHLAH
jgi:hypothetical protein